MSINLTGLRFLSLKKSLLTVIRHKVFWIVAVSLLIRIGFSFYYPIRHIGDTSEYYSVAQMLFNTESELAKNRPSYSRPPGYPLLIAISDGDPETVVLLQSAMGVAIAVLIYLIFSRLTGNELIGLFAGFAYGLNPSQLLFERALASETATTLLVILSTFLLFHLLRYDSRVKWFRPVLLGLTLAMCSLTRSEYNALTVLALIYIALSLRGSLKKRLANVVLLVFPLILLTGVWTLYKTVKLPGEKYNYVFPGLQIATHTIGIVDNAPDRYAIIRDIMVKHREQYRREGGVDMCWSFSKALPELLNTTGMTREELSDTLLAMSAVLLKQDPVGLLASPARAFARFFKPTWYSHQFGIRAVIAGERLSSKIVAVIYALFHVACMAVFLVYPLIYLVSTRLRIKNILCRETIFIYLLVGIINLSSSIMIIGDNMRYKTPVEPLMIGMAVWIGVSLVLKIREWKKAS